MIQLNINCKYIYIQKAIYKFNCQLQACIMEGNGMFNGPIKELTQNIYDNTPFTISEVRLICQTIGLPISQNYSKQRIFFTIAQVILNLIDKIISKDRYQLQQQTKLSFSLSQSFSYQLGLEGKSMVNSSPHCLAGNLNISALIFSIFCPKMSIWDIINRITSIKQKLQKSELILEDVTLSNRIFKPQNLKDKYVCYCQMYPSPPYKQRDSFRCQHCLSIFHEECQSTNLLCNSCYMRFCLMDLENSISDPFNLNKEIYIYYFSYIQNDYPFPHSTDNCIFFHIVRFDIPELSQQMDRKEKCIQIRVCIADGVFPSELQLTSRAGMKVKQKMQLWEVDNIEYYFYLNHIPISYTNSISKNCITFNVMPRNLSTENNVLVIKCVKKENNFRGVSQIPIYSLKNENKTKKIMVGVFMVAKTKQKKKYNPNFRSNSVNALNNVTMSQSYYYLEFIFKRIHDNINYQIVDLIDVQSKKKMETPVRSYGCNHLECFDFDQFKNKIKSTAARHTQTKSNILPIASNTVYYDLDNDVIEIQSDSVQIINHVVLEPPLRKKSTINIKNYSRTSRFRRKIQRQKKTENPQSLYCPICNRKLLALYVDPLFTEILRNSGFYSKVKILQNGEYTFEGAKSIRDK